MDYDSEHMLSDRTLNLHKYKGLHTSGCSTIEVDRSPYR